MSSVHWMRSLIRDDEVWALPVGPGAQHCCGQTVTDSDSASDHLECGNEEVPWLSLVLGGDSELSPWVWDSLVRAQSGCSHVLYCLLMRRCLLSCAAAAPASTSPDPEQSQQQAATGVRCCLAVELLAVWRRHRRLSSPPIR